jgi:hypothetical protein
MIKLSENRTALVNIPITIKAIDDFDDLINYYSVDKPGPAYCTFKGIDGPGEISVQIDRPIMVETLKLQRQKLVDYLVTLGIEA